MGATKSRFRFHRRSTKRSQSMNEADITPKVVLLTGSSYKLSLEFGLTLAEDSLSRFKVIVAMPSFLHSDYLGDSRVLEQLQSQNLTLMQMNVESEASIAEILREIIDIHGLIDGIVITSNVLLTGSLESHTMDQAQTVFETNTFSTIRLVKSVMPAMKKQRGGRIILVTNQAGIQGLPFHGIYCASKFAIEGFLETVAPECLAFNIYASIIETSLAKGEENTARTLQVSIGSKVDCVDEETRKCQDSFSNKLRRQGSVKKLNSNRVAQTILEVLIDEKPHFRYQLNRSSKIAAREKWVDVHGDSYVLDAAEKYLCVETERLKEALDHINSNQVPQ